MQYGAHFSIILAFIILAVDIWKLNIDEEVPEICTKQTVRRSSIHSVNLANVCVFPLKFEFRKIKCLYLKIKQL